MTPLVETRTTRLARAGHAATGRVMTGMWRSRGSRTGLVLLGVLVVAVYAGPLLVPYDPEALNRTDVLTGPSGAHPLGTDQYGRDQLSRLLEGGQRSLEAVSLVLGASLLAGMLVGVAAGVFGGWVDVVLMRVVDVLLAIPAMVLVLAMLGALGPGFGTVVVALTVGTWPPYARMARSFVLSGRGRPDVVCARMAGVGWSRAAAGHLVPGAAAQLMVLVSLDIGHTVMSVAGLSFLGLGVLPPAAEWGAMLSAARPFLGQAPWLLAPAAAIVLVVLAANLLGEALTRTRDEVVR